MLGSLIVGFTITWWITIETGSMIYLSISVFLMFIPQIIVTPFAGVLADRWNKKAILAISDSLQAFVTLVLFLLFLVDLQSIWLVLAINTIRAALFAFQLPTVHALIPSMVPQENISRVNGMNFLFNGLIFSIGPVIAATLLAFLTIEQIFLIDIFTFLAAVVPLLIIKIPKIHQITESPENFTEIITEESTKISFFQEYKTGMRAIKLVPGLMAMIMFAMIWNFIMRPWTVLMPYFVKYVHGGSALDLAILGFSFQLASIIGAIIAMSKKDFKSKIKINIIGATIYFVGLIPAILAPTGNFLFMMISIFPGAVMFPIAVTTYLTILQKVVPKDKIGRVMSLDHMISMAIAPFGALISGPLAELLGIINLYIICAIIGVIYPTLIWFFTKIRHLEGIDQEITRQAALAKEQEIIHNAAQTKEQDIIEVVEIVE